MGPTWRHFRTPNRFRIASKIHSDFDTLSEASWARFLKECGKQNGSFGDAFRVEFCGDLQHAESVKIVLFPKRKCVPRSSAARVVAHKFDENLMLRGLQDRLRYRRRFLMDFDGIGVPCWDPRGHGNRVETMSKNE